MLRRAIGHIGLLLPFLWSGCSLLLHETTFADLDGGADAAFAMRDSSADARQDAMGADGCESTAELCNLADDDCDGDVDEDAADCTVTNGTSICVAGECQFVECHPGYAGCLTDPSSVCETDLTNSRLNCGACERVCPLHGPCTASACRQSYVRWAEPASTTTGVELAIVAENPEGYLLAAGVAPSALSIGGASRPVTGESAFVARFGPGGVVDWVRIAEPSPFVAVLGVGSTGDRVYVVGTFVERMAVDSDVVAIGPTGRVAAYVWELGIDGASRSMSVITSTGSVTVTAVAAADDGGVHVAGHFSGEIAVDGGTPRASQGIVDAFLVHRTAGGAVNVQAWGVEGGRVRATALVATPSGAVVVGGDYNARFAIGASSLSAPVGDDDVWIAQIEPAGEASFVHFAGGPRPDRLMALAADATGAVYFHAGFAPAREPDEEAGLRRATFPVAGSVGRSSVLGAFHSGSGSSRWVRALDPGAITYRGTLTLVRVPSSRLAVHGTGRLYLLTEARDGDSLEDDAVLSVEAGAGVTLIGLSSVDGSLRWARVFRGSEEIRAIGLGAARFGELGLGLHHRGTASLSDHEFSPPGGSGVVVARIGEELPRL